MSFLPCSKYLFICLVISVHCIEDVYKPTYHYIHSQHPKDVREYDFPRQFDQIRKSIDINPGNGYFLKLSQQTPAESEPKQPAFYHGETSKRKSGYYMDKFIQVRNYIRISGPDFRGSKNEVSHDLPKLKTINLDQNSIVVSHSFRVCRPALILDKIQKANDENLDFINFK